MQFEKKKKRKYRLTQPGANLFGRGGESRAQRWIDGLPCRRHFFWRDTQSVNASEAVELSGVTQQSTVAPLAHIRHDAPDGWQHGVERRAATIFERGKKLCCLRCATAFCPDQLHRLLRKFVH